MTEKIYSSDVLESGGYWIKFLDHLKFEKILLH